MGQPGIVIYRMEYESVRDKLTFEQKGRLLDALFDFSETGEEYVGNDPFVSMCFCFFSAAIKRSAEQYERRSRANAENIRRRWEKDDTNNTKRTNGINRIDSLETKQNESNQSKTKPSKRKEFFPPSLEEVAAYCTERNNGIDAAAFIDHYEARGWELRPGIKMKSWQAAIRTWEHNRKEWITGHELQRACRGNQAPGQRSEYMY